MNEELQPIRDIFPERLKKARKFNVVEVPMTQEHLAEICGIPSTSISHFESGKSERLPNVENLRKLACALSVSTDYLLGLSEKRGRL